MAVTYTPQTWNDDDPTTPVDSARLGHMESGISAVATEINNHETSVAQQFTALNGTFAPLVSPALTGTPKVNGYQIRQAHGTGIALLGDSLTDKNYFTNGSTVWAYQSDGFMTWAQIGLRQRAHITGVFGYSGQTAATINTHIPDAMATSPGIVHYEGGVNDVNNDRSYAQIIADIQAGWNALWAAGCGLIVMPTITPQYASNVGGTYSTSRKLITYQVNEWLREQAAAKQNLIVYDVSSILLDPAGTGTALNGLLRSGDGTHPLPITAAAWGARLATVLDKVLPQFDVLTNAGDPTNLLTTQSTSWSLFNSDGSTASGITSSTVARTDDVPGNWRQLVTTAQTGASLQAQCLGTYNPGDVLVARCEFQRNNDWSITGTGNLCFRLNLRAVPSFNSSYCLNNNSGDPFPAASVPLSGVLETPKFTVPAGTGAGGIYLIPEFAGVGTLRIGRAEVRKVA